MKKVYSILVFLLFAISQCFWDQQAVNDTYFEISNEILTRENPGKGVVNLSLQSPLFKPGEPHFDACSAELPEGQKLLIESICNSQKECLQADPVQRAACYEESLSDGLKAYKHAFNMKEGKNRDDFDEKQVEKKLFVEIKRVASGLEEVLEDLGHDTGDDSDEKEDSDEKNSDHDDDSDEPEYDVLTRLNQLYDQLESIKTRYSPKNKVQVWVRLLAVNVEHETLGWLNAANHAEWIDIANPDLNKVLAINTLEPGRYNAIEFLFDSQVKMYMNNSEATVDQAFSSEPHKKHGDDKDDDHDGDNTVSDDEPVMGLPWEELPVTFAEGAVPLFQVEQSWEVRAGEVISIAAGIDVEKSLEFEEDQLVFEIQGFVTGLAGDSVQTPELPVDVVADNGNIAINAPANTLTEPVQFLVTPVTEATLPAPVEESSTLVSSYEFEPSMVFEAPVTLTFKYDPAMLVQNNMTENHLYAAYYDEDKEEWIKIPSFKVNPAASTVEVYTKHFTIVSLFGGNFRIEYPDGVVAKVQYSALNYFLDKVMPIQNPTLIGPANRKKDVIEGQLSSTMPYVINYDFRPKHVKTTNFKYDITPVRSLPGVIDVRIQLKDNTYPYTYLTEIGDVDISYYQGIALSDENCSRSLRKCRSGCSSWGWFEGLCLGDCKNKYNICKWATNPSRLGFTINLYKSLSIYHLDVSIRLIMTVDPETNTISYEFVKMIPHKDDSGQWFRWITSDRKPPTASNLVADIAVKLENIKHVLNEQIYVTLLNWFLPPSAINFGEQLSGTLNLAFSDSMPNTTLALEADGFTIRSDLAQEIPGEDRSGQCAGGAPALSIPGNTPNTGADYLTSDVHVGTSFSLNVFSQVFTQFAKQGYFCVDTPVGALPNDQITVTPTSAASVTYVPNNVLRISMMSKVDYRVMGTSQEREFGKFIYYFRLKPNLANGKMELELIEIEDTFANPALRPLVDAFVGGITPDMFPFSFDVPNPLSRSGLHKSMFRLQDMSKQGNNLVMNYYIAGLPVDYSNANGSREWLWTKKYTPQERGCAPYLKGVLRKTTVSGLYKLVFPNGSFRWLRNQSVNGVLFGNAINKVVSMEGNCKGSTFYAKNILDGHFYMGSGNVSLSKKNYAVQKIGPYGSVFGLHAINIKDTKTPEVLALRKTKTGIKLDWYLGNRCCQSAPGDIIKYTMNLPAKHVTEGLYRVKVIKKNSGYDQLMLNCTVYDVVADSSTVSLKNGDCPQERQIVPKYAYINNIGNDSISQYTIATDGSLAPMSPTKAFTQMRNMRIISHPNGKYVYTSSVGLIPPNSAAIHQFAVGADGGLVSMRPFKEYLSKINTNGHSTIPMVFHPNKKTMYAHDQGYMFQYSVGSNGRLYLARKIGTTPYSFRSLAVTPNGKYIFGTTNTHIWLGKIDADTKRVRSNSAMKWLNVNDGISEIAIHSNGRYMYIVNGATTSIHQLYINDNGTLTRMPETGIRIDKAPISLAIHPGGKYLYVANYDSKSITRFKISANGQLVFLDRANVGLKPSVVRVSPNGKHLYVTTVSPYNRVKQYNINASTGALSFYQPGNVGTGPTPWGITIIGRKEFR